MGKWVSSHHMTVYAHKGDPDTLVYEAYYTRTWTRRLACAENRWIKRGGYSGPGIGFPFLA